MNAHEEMKLLDERLTENGMFMWNSLDKQTRALCGDLEHVQMTAVAIFVVTGKEVGKTDQRIYAVATVANATIPSEQIDMILEMATATHADTVTKEVRPQ